MSILYVGVDVSRKHLDVATCHGEAQAVFLGKFTNDQAGFGQLAQALQDLKASAIHLVMEPTGGYEQLLARFAIAQGWRVSLPNPAQVRDWARAEGRRSKTDRQDALLLARYGAHAHPPEWCPLPVPVEALEALLLRREDLQAMLRQELNRQLALQSRDAYHGPVARSLDASIAAITQALTEIEQAIQDHLDQHPDLKQQAKWLRQVPGVGKKNALFILVLLHRWSTLTQRAGSSKGLTAYVGLDPVAFTSGTSVYKRPGISRKGNKIVRHYLYLGALGGVRGRNALCVFYQRLLARGKPKKLALVAAARKMLTWAWAVFRNQTPFNHALSYAH
ncbi:MAG: IS110 family transposase [Chloroflexi bacterium]|nr:IS110 family transposase [Chloroflexota bacterium]